MLHSVFLNAKQTFRKKTKKKQTTKTANNEINKTQNKTNNLHLLHVPELQLIWILNKKDVHWRDSIQGSNRFYVEFSEIQRFTSILTWNLFCLSQVLQLK